MFFYFLDSLVKNEKHNGEFIKLRHPQTGDLAIFFYSESDNKLAQLRSLPFNHRYTFVSPCFNIVFYKMVFYVFAVFILDHFLAVMMSFLLTEWIL